MQQIVWKLESLIITTKSKKQFMTVLLTWDTSFWKKTKTKQDYIEKSLKFIPECIKQGSCWHVYINNYFNQERPSYALRQISKQRSRLEILHCVYTGKDLNIDLVDYTVTWVLRQWVYRDCLL